EIFPLYGTMSGSSLKLKSLCVADLRGDRKPLLVYSYTWGANGERSQVAVLDLFAKEPAPVVAAQTLWLDPTHAWTVKSPDGKAVRVEGDDVVFGELVYEEKDGKATLRIKIRDDVPPTIKKNVEEK